MKELVEIIAKALVDDKDAVVVTVDESETDLIINLSVAKDDIGKVIGKRGRIVKAIRSLVKAAAYDDNRHVDVEIA